MIRQTAQAVIDSFRRGGKLLICGNGGSAAQAQHMAAELIGKYKKDRKALPAIALTTDTSVLTSVSNDMDYSRVFTRQIEALGKKGDVLISLSTSGRSANCNEALKLAEQMKLVPIDLERIGNDTPTIQENHLYMIHRICEIVEEAFV